MLSSGIPLRFTMAWGKNAAGAYIRTVPVASQIGIQDGAASFNDGFVPDNFTTLAGGGVPPFGQDFNGILNVTTTWDQWYQAGAPIPYDLTFSTAISGYPKGAKLDSAIVPGAQWYSTVDGNTTNPDDPLTATNWERVGIPAGVPVPFLTATLPAGFVAMNGLTIGNASSNATGRANADTLFAYVANWTGFSNTQCPILTSAGAPSTRGANAVADFNANKQLTLPSGKGLSFIGVDTMGGSASTFLSGVPVTIGNATTPGSILGESLHQLTTAELASHTHVNTVSNPSHLHGGIPADSGIQANSPPGGHIFNTIGQSANTGSATQNTTITNVAAGSDTAHNTVHRSMGVFWGQKL